MENIEQTHQSKIERARRSLRITLCIVLPVFWVISLILTAGVTFLLTKILSYNGKKDVLTDSISDAIGIIRENYYFYDSDETELTKAALKGVVNSTGDTYATYYSAEEYAELTKQNSGAYIGIGISMTMKDDGTVWILEVYDNTPASEAGLKPNDQIIRINGVSYEGLDLSTFIDNVVAEDGAQNEITVLRDGEEQSFTIVAREVHSPTVFSKMITDIIGYIRIASFHGTCVDETEAALDTLKASGMKMLILDLRDNLGGSLYDALDIADLFLPKDHLITSLRSRTDQEKTYYTKTDGLDLEMVLLVNRYSASASELVAGALKDYETAYLIGEKTYGKGIVQSYFDISETGGMLKITTEAYYTPNGICVHGIGIEPDKTVVLSEEAGQYSISVLPFELDLQLQAAIDYLENN